MGYDPLNVNSKWTVRFRPTLDPSARLVCFPHAGGSASYFYGASQSIAPTVDLLAIQYPGRQDRHSENLVDSISGLADSLQHELLPLCDRPLALFGHSMGAILAFEVAVRLTREGHAPLCVFASGRRAPSCERDERVHLQDDEHLLAEIRKLGGTDLGIFLDPEVLKLALPVIRNDYKATETYQCTQDQKVSCPVVVLVGDQDPKVTMNEARAWRDHTTGTFHLQSFPGGHFYLNSRVSEIVELISSRIDHLASDRRQGHQ